MECPFKPIKKVDYWERYSGALQPQCTKVTFGDCSRTNCMAYQTSGDYRCALIEKGVKSINGTI